MSEPTRLKAAATGAFIGAPTIILSGWATAAAVLGLNSHEESIESFFSFGIPSGQIFIPIIFLLPPFSLYVASRLFISSKEFLGTFITTAVACTVAIAAAGIAAPFIL